jgi:hypothetical protein
MAWALLSRLSDWLHDTRFCVCSMQRCEDPNIYGRSRVYHASYSCGDMVSYLKDSYNVSTYKVIILPESRFVFVFSFSVCSVFPFVRYCHDPLMMITPMTDLPSKHRFFQAGLFSFDFIFADRAGMSIKERERETQLVFFLPVEMDIWIRM